MQFSVPQFIEIEDKIIGPFTLKQFFYLAGGGVLVALLWYFLKFWLFILLALPVAGLAVALSFVKINGRPFLNFLGSMFGYFAKPKVYVWKNKND
ncbi:MAG: hypothetical protein COU85_01740 [Candidatus Portnoybacteria bacterium CG10_big_fil_rev_8_21_14_0_10_44_7]|uniref:PrgI family protein n=1 Tax=Candidatus Portnoybacteria bacterium CG10_big_fil_rev_8_21_14_0_10_44_7 TaxID=1974816 RepID=A0A2M8KIS2_9BACT|nr:MAG: hypothetical protein COU85_01740 [Candidatus Portnoybacteria bacterium CG10_big_fil_rev_8_21_14_0_10_44_7]